MQNPDDLLCEKFGKALEKNIELTIHGFLEKEQISENPGSLLLQSLIVTQLIFLWKNNRFSIDTALASYQEKYPRVYEEALGTAISEFFEQAADPKLLRQQFEQIHNSHSSRFQSTIELNYAAVLCERLSVPNLPDRIREQCDFLGPQNLEALVDHLEAVRGNLGLEAYEHPPYVFGKQIGRGGFGEVYLGSQSLSGGTTRRVAIKAVRTSQQLPPEAIENEVRALAEVNHINTVKIFDQFTIAEVNSVCIVMDYVDGRHITHYVADEDCDLTQLLRKFSEVCSAVGNLHQKGIKHCDLKPENIFVDQDDNVRLVDFGLAQANQSSAADHRSARPLGGTPGFASPEQRLGEPVDATTDVFSLGAILKVLLNSVVERKRAEGIKLRDSEQQVIQDVKATIDQCLRENKLERFASADKLNQAIRSILTEIEEHDRTVALMKNLGEKILNKRMFIAASLFGVFLFGVAGIWHLATRGPTTPPPSSPPEITSAELLNRFGILTVKDGSVARCSFLPGIAEQLASQNTDDKSLLSDFSMLAKLMEDQRPKREISSFLISNTALQEALVVARDKTFEYSIEKQLGTGISRLQSGIENQDNGQLREAVDVYTKLLAAMDEGRIEDSDLIRMHCFFHRGISRRTILTRQAPDDSRATLSNLLLSDVLKDLDSTLLIAKQISKETETKALYEKALTLGTLGRFNLVLECIVPCIKSLEQDATWKEGTPKKKELRTRLLIMSLFTRGDTFGEFGCFDDALSDYARAFREIQSQFPEDYVKEVERIVGPRDQVGQKYYQLLANAALVACGREDRAPTKTQIEDSVLIMEALVDWSSREDAALLQGLASVYSAAQQFELANEALDLADAAGVATPEIVEAIKTAREYIERRERVIDPVIAPWLESLKANRPTGIECT